MKIFLEKLLHFRFGYAIINKLFGAKQYAPLAQLDRASGYGPEGRGFESLQTVGDTENIYWKNREILEKQKATPIGTLSVQLKISRLVWLDGTP